MPWIGIVPQHQTVVRFDLSAQPFMDPFRQPRQALAGIMTKRQRSVKVHLVQPSNRCFVVWISSQTGLSWNRSTAPTTRFF